jgi:hypothetical protein
VSGRGLARLDGTQCSQIRGILLKFDKIQRIWKWTNLSNRSIVFKIQSHFNKIGSNSTENGRKIQIRTGPNFLQLRPTLTTKF